MGHTTDDDEGTTPDPIPAPWWPGDAPSLPQAVPIEAAADPSAGPPAPPPSPDGSAGPPLADDAAYPLPPEAPPRVPDRATAAGDYADWIPADEEGFAALLGTASPASADAAAPSPAGRVRGGAAAYGRPLTDPGYPPPDPNAFRPISPAPRSYPADAIAPSSPEPGSFRPRSRWRTALGTLLVSVFGAVIAIGILLGLGVLEPAGDDVVAPEEITRTTILERVRTDLVTPLTTEAGLATAVGLKVIPSIVTVQVGVTFGDSTQAIASGSGVILTEDGLIATNEHVVAEGEFFQVILNDGRTYEAELIGMDALTDLAVLRIDAVGLEPIEIGTTDDKSIGDTAIAVGNPLDLEGGPSLTVGVISAFNREVDVGDPDSPQLFGMVQTDASFTKGSSGGALVDAEGRLIGITTAISVSSGGAEGIGFATPAEMVVRITSEIIDIGRVRHAFLGITGRDYLVSNPDGSTSPAGAEVVSLEGADSAAQAGGLVVGDRILSYDGKPVNRMQDLVIGLRRYYVGDPVVFEVERDGETLSITVELGERPEGV